MREKGRGEAASAHATQDGGGEALLASSGRESLQLDRLVGEVERRLEPAQTSRHSPLNHVLVTPHGRISAADGPVRPFLLNGNGTGSRQGRLELCVVQAEIQGEGVGGVGVGHCWRASWQGLVE